VELLDTAFGQSYVVKVVVTWTVWNFVTDEIFDISKDASMTLNALDLFVGLEPVDAGNKPELAKGRICLNAQAEYKKAKWKAIVLPEGTKATVTAVSGGVSVPSGTSLSNGNTFWVEGGTTTGDYTIKIAHNSLPDICKETKGEKAFKFIKKDVGISGGSQTTRTPLGNDNTYWQSYAAMTPGNKFESVINLKMERLCGPVSSPTILQEVEYQYKMVTEPSGCYQGKLKSYLLICTDEAISINASGVMGNNFISISSVKIDFTDTINVSGLARGNGSCTPHLHSVQVPINLYDFDDTLSFKGGLEWIPSQPVYNIGDTVTVKNTCTMIGIREGTIPLGGSGSGNSKVIGFSVNNATMDIIEED